MPRKGAEQGVAKRVAKTPVANYIGTKRSGDLLFVSGRVSQLRGEVGTERVAMPGTHHVDVPDGLRPHGDAAPCSSVHRRAAHVDADPPFPSRRQRESLRDRDVTRAVDRLSLNLGVGLLDAEFESFPGGGAGNTDASGKELPGAAPVQARELRPRVDSELPVHMPLHIAVVGEKAHAVCGL